MNQPQIASLGPAIALGIVHYLGEGLKIPEGAKHYRLISFAAGVSISYLFLDLLPHTYKAATHMESRVFLFLLLGFATVYLVEKYFYQHGKKTKLHSNFKIVHSVTFFLYYFLVGCVLVELTQASILEGTLFVFPLPLTMHNITISTIAGILLYVFVKEFLPEREKGQPIFFILGLILFYLALTLIRFLIH